MAYTTAPVTAEAMTAFLTKLQAMMTAHYAAMKLPAPKMEAMEGQKFARVIRTGPAERSAYCFVEKSTGLIFKPAGWKGPAKHARGSIYTAELSGLTPYGAEYLR
jgi:hypothetical protein